MTDMLKTAVTDAIAHVAGIDPTLRHEAMAEAAIAAVTSAQMASAGTLKSDVADAIAAVEGIDTLVRHDAMAEAAITTIAAEGAEAAIIAGT